MSASAPARDSARGGPAARVTRAAHHPPAVVLDVFGRRVRIEPGGHPAAAQVDALWSRCRAAEARGDNETETVIALPRSDRPLAAGTGLRLTEEIRALAVAAAEDRLLLLHAAAVATPGGAVLGLVAAEHAVRSAAAAELSRRGFGYVTDELLAIDESFAVEAFPEPLTFRQGEPGAGTTAGPDALGMRPCPEAALHLTALVLLEHDPDRREPPELVRVHHPDDVRRLSGAVVSVPSSWTGTVLTDLVDETAGVWQLRYGDVHQVVSLLADLLLDRTRPVVGPDDLYVAVGLGGKGRAGSSLLTGHDLALDGLRRVVWQSAAGGATLESLHAAANLELGGDHPVSVPLVSAAVHDLLALGLLVPGRPSGHSEATTDLVDGLSSIRR